MRSDHHYVIMECFIIPREAPTSESNHSSVFLPPCPWQPLSTLSIYLFWTFHKWNQATCSFCVWLLSLGVMFSHPYWAYQNVTPFHGWVILHAWKFHISFIHVSVDGHANLIADIVKTKNKNELINLKYISYFFIFVYILKGK